jgi:hypothetical protein
MQTVFEEFPDDLRGTRRAIDTLEGYIDEVLWMIDYETVELPLEEQRRVVEDLVARLDAAIERGRSMWGAILVDYQPKVKRKRKLDKAAD